MPSSLCNSTLRTQLTTPTHKFSIAVKILLTEQYLTNRMIVYCCCSHSNDSCQVRVHLPKESSTDYWKKRNFFLFYDDMAVVWGHPGRDFSEPTMFGRHFFKISATHGDSPRSTQSLNTCRAGGGRLTMGYRWPQGLPCESPWRGGGLRIATQLMPALTHT